MSASQQTGEGQQPPGRTSNGKTRAPRKARGKNKTARKPSPPLAAGQTPRITPTPARQTAMNVRGLTAAATAARATGKVSPFLMEALFQQLPAAGEPWTDQQNQVFLEAVAANTKLIYGLKSTITITAKTA